LTGINLSKQRKNELFPAPEAIAMPRVHEDPKATPRKQEDPMAMIRRVTTKNKLFQAHEALAMPRVLKDPKATPTLQQIQKKAFSSS
jgi:hypothetical protein